MPVFSKGDAENHLTRDDLPYGQQETFIIIAILSEEAASL